MLPSQQPGSAGKSDTAGGRRNFLALAISQKGLCCVLFSLKKKSLADPDSAPGMQGSLADPQNPEWVPFAAPTSSTRTPQHVQYRPTRPSSHSSEVAGPAWALCWTQLLLLPGISKCSPVSWVFSAESIRAPTAQKAHLLLDGPERNPERGAS